MLLDITATDPDHTGDYLHNISLVPLEYEALHEAGQIFNPDWLAVVQDARELRFMDWMGTNGVTHASWADRPQVGDVSWAGGVPLEVMVELANQTGTEPWFNMPAGADEVYIRTFATYVRDHLNPGLMAHVEYSNEMWNWSFAQTKWLGEQAKTVWGSKDGAAWLDYAAMLATKSALIWDDVFGAAADARVDNVMGTQTVNTWIADRLLTAPIWQNKDPSGYVDPSKVFNSLAVTTYFGGWEISDPTQRALLLAAIKDSSVDATAWLKARLLDPAVSFSIPQLEAYWTANKIVADKYGLDLVAYEGGQHVLHSFAVSGLPEADLATLTTFLTSFVRSQAMAELYHELWTAWAAVSDGPFMQFGDVAAASKYGAWGLFSALGDHNPRADLLMDLNAHSASWFGTGGGEQYQQGVIKVAADVGETLVGTDDDDFLIGGLGKDVIVAGKGHDAISGGRGVDTLVLTGSPSDYTLTAEDDGYRLKGPGTEHYIRGIENFQFDGNLNLSLAEVLNLALLTDTLPVGTLGNDALLGTTGDDTIDAKAGNDSVYGDNGRDIVQGSTGNDILYGGNGWDALDGGIGNDTLIGDTGNDNFYVNSTADVVVENADEGTDTVKSTVNWTLAVNFENLTLLGGVTGTGNVLANEIGGNAGANSLSGLDGNDTIFGAAGNDVIDGGAGVDSLVGGAGNDTYVIDSLSDVVVESAAEGTDTVKVSLTYTLGTNLEDMMLIGSLAIDGTGNGVANILTGNDQANSLSGLDGNDTMLGGGGNDTLNGGTGMDSLTGGLGDDLYLVDATTDKVIESVGGGINSVQSTVSFTLAANIEALTLLGTALTGMGNVSANTLTGNGLANLLSGSTGNDTIYSGLGSDTLDGGLGLELAGGRHGRRCLSGRYPCRCCGREC